MHQLNPRLRQAHPLQLRLQFQLHGKVNQNLDKLVGRLPQLIGEAITVSFNPQLTAYRGKLLSGRSDEGIAVYAGSFLRKRSVVLESDLLLRPNSMRLILIHELFHFVWMRLSNQKRLQFAELLRQEVKRGAKGEVGESASVKKERLRNGDSDLRNSRWRDYVCESFCDTAAWHFSRLPRHSFFTLAKKWTSIRRTWLIEAFPACINC